MKSITILGLLIILLTTLSSPAQTKEGYLLKSRHQKTAAWIMMSGGSGLLVVGTIVGITGTVDLLTWQLDKANNNIGVSGILIIAGGAAMLGSIPLFIASGKNRRRAMNLTFTNQPLPALLQNITANRAVLSISLKIIL